jgi:azurin
VPASGPTTRTIAVREDYGVPARSASKAAKHQTTMPADWNGTVDQTVSVQGVEGLKFSLASFDVKPGARVKLDFANTSDMLHNLVVVKPGAGTKVGEAALKLGLDGQKLDYVPKSDDVLFNTSLLEPQKVESIYFVAPTTPGEYQYVCTFPGHYLSMQGTMRVIR